MKRRLAIFTIFFDLFMHAFNMLFDVVFTINVRTQWTLFHDNKRLKLNFIDCKNSVLYMQIVDISRLRLVFELKKMTKCTVLAGCVPFSCRIQICLFILCFVLVDAKCNRTSDTKQIGGRHVCRTFEIDYTFCYSYFYLCLICELFFKTFSKITF